MTTKNQIYSSRISNSKLVISVRQENFDVTILSLNNEPIIGTPSLGLAFLLNMITGIKITFDRFQNSKENPFTENQQLIPSSSTKIKNSIGINIVGHDVKNIYYKSLIKRLKASIINRLSRINSFNSKPKITILEFYKAVFAVVEAHNRIVLQTSHYPYMKKQCGLAISEKEQMLELLYCSIINSRKLWWINLTTNDLPINRRGIILSGDYFVPSEFDALCEFESLINKKGSSQASVFSNPLLPFELYWIHGKRLIPLVKQKNAISKNNSIVPNQTKQSTTMKKLKKTTLMIQKYRSPSKHKKQSKAISGTQNNSSKLLTPKLQWNCDYLLNRYLSVELHI